MNPMFGDDLILAGHTDQVAAALLTIIKYSENLVYFVLAEKSWCIVGVEKEAAAQRAHKEAGLTVLYTSGHCYVRGFIRSVEREEKCITP